LRIVGYLCSLLIAVICTGLLIEFLAAEFTPDVYRGYLIKRENNTVTWSFGPFEPAERSKGFNTPIPVDKPENTLRIVTLGDSITEGWLTAKVVFQNYQQQWTPQSISSYSRALEYSINSIASPESKNIEVINLGVAAYNVTDVIRMLKESLTLEPDLLVIQIGGNETWTAERGTWSSYLDNDIPYFHTEAAYEVQSGIQSTWTTLSSSSNAFNPLALFSAKPQPILPEPAERAAGLDSRLENYLYNLEGLGAFLKKKNIPAIFLVAPQNIAEFLPYGSMAKVGTSPEQIEELNAMLIAALADTDATAKDRYLEILSIDDGIAEANFQLGKIYLAENNIDKAREYFWRANDRDLVLKRPPSAFHQATRDFAAANGFPIIDVTGLFEERSESGLVGYNFLDDEVHPNRPSQFLLGAEVTKLIVDKALLPEADFSADLEKMPNFDGYNTYTGFDDEAFGTISYLKAAHNYLSFGHYRVRAQWDPRPEVFLDPILNNLDIAIDKADLDSARYLSFILNMLLDRQEAAIDMLKTLDCAASPERAAQVNIAILQNYRRAVGPGSPALRESVVNVLDEKGCAK